MTRCRDAGFGWHGFSVSDSNPVAAMMKKLTAGLLVVNVIAIAWLVLGARMELPPMQEAFDRAKDVVETIETEETMQWQKTAARANIENAESFSKITIQEYKRAEPLFLLTIANIAVLSLIVFRTGTPRT